MKSQKSKSFTKVTSSHCDKHTHGSITQMFESFLWNNCSPSVDCSRMSWQLLVCTDWNETHEEKKKVGQSFCLIRLWVTWIPLCDLTCRSDGLHTRRTKCLEPDNSFGTKLWLTESLMWRQMFPPRSTLSRVAMPRGWKWLWGRARSWRVP